MTWANKVVLNFKRGGEKSGDSKTVLRATTGHNAWDFVNWSIASNLIV